MNASVQTSPTESWRATIAAAKFRDETQLVEDLLQHTPYDSAAASRIEDHAAAMVTRARANKDRPLLDTFLTQYGLSNKEGIALMCLAESLLRIPDQRTAERLIADKIQFGDWASHAGQAGSLLVNTSTWALMLGSKLVDVDRGFSANPGEWLGQLTTRLTEPVIEKAMRAAMRILGREFVLGETIESALENSVDGRFYSYDMLGEGARDASTAKRYFDSYLHAIEHVGGAAKVGDPSRPSISIKLSALHPRYEPAQRQRVIRELLPVLKQLCLAADERQLQLTIDAEEADRLQLSLDLFEQLARAPELAQFSGLGLAVQAYGKRALPVLNWMAALAGETGRRFPVRLVKGAYWDTEIKQAQIRGYPGFPVFTRKASTDLSYLLCAKQILGHPERMYGQFATHNAHTVAAIIEMADSGVEFEFQRLFGMGEMLYAAARSEYSNFPPIRTYAPVGSYDDLLAYLVRRLLENGANSSFVNRFLDEKLTPRELVRDPLAVVRGMQPIAHPDIRLPAELFAPQRVNSSGMDLTSDAVLTRLQSAYRGSQGAHFRATPLIAGKAVEAPPNDVLNPANYKDIVGGYADAEDPDIDRAFALAARDQVAWDALGGDKRATLIEAFGSRLEAESDRLIPLLCREAGKTLPDALGEVREAVDFCRYYAVQARAHFGSPTLLPGPTGESNVLSLHGRGVFVCISPWNFPLAIFVGQIVAALAAGNTVVAKPAEETPLIAYEAVRLLHAVGVPGNVCQLIIGGGEIGARLVRHPLTGGVVFTGGTDTARRINRAMAEREGPIAPLIAETGGQNAMVVDSSALLEQATDDVIQSAFLSAGQRCSALRVLYLQDDIADQAMRLIKGAMDQLIVGDPSKIATDVGPIISRQAADALNAHVRRARDSGQLLHVAQLAEECSNGTFVAPSLLEIRDIGELDREHFGPILHVIRFPEADFESVIDEIASTGFGLTFGLHTRIQSRVEQAAASVGVGNVYSNRNMIGAVVGSQPFGGQGLSGTGPKAGGPHYLLRFATERVVTINTVATGGNPELLMLD